MGRGFPRQIPGAGFVEFCQRKKEDLKPKLMCCWTQELLRSEDMGVLEKRVIRAVCEGSMRDLLGAELLLWGDNVQDRRRTRTGERVLIPGQQVFFR